MKKEQGKWYIVDHANGYCVIRGPYKNSETASAIRKELETSHPDRNWNLWITDRGATPI